MLDMSMAPQMEMQVNPAMLNLAQLLALPAMSLQQTVQQELADNPSLEEIETDDTPCEICGGPVVEGVCLRCVAQSSNIDQPLTGNGEEQVDPLLFVASPQSTTERLLEDMYASLPEKDHHIAVALMGSLDEQGFLAEEPDDIAATLTVDAERVQGVLRKLQELGPPGLATRDTRECMLMQIQALTEQGIQCPHVYAIVEQHMDALGAHHYRQIARELQISAAEVEAAQEFIQHHLWPYPAMAAQQSTAEPDRTPYRVPDLAIVEKDGDFVVEVLNSPRRMLRMNPLYQELARTQASLGEEERAHVQEYVSRTRVFLSNLRQRESTLKQIAEAIVVRQQEFLRHGIRHLAPMTRAEIAEELEMHESTISRAVAEKTAMLPDKTLMPLREFFASARSVQDVLRELIAQETTPLSDQELADILTSRGYDIARRTVAKYRGKMKILPSHLR